VAIDVAADIAVLDAPPQPPKPEQKPDKPDVSLGYTPGFDGLRALGLLLMLGYHSGQSWAAGGIFTVSMFFTLSGYLIATLTLVEWSKHDRVSLARFWERRAKRLLPAALLTIAGVIALQYFFEVGSDQSRFRGDVLGALGYVANWRMAFSGGDYGRIFRIESPVQHFWSLAVEEQFYVAFPLLFVGLMALTKGRWKIVGTVFGLGAAASFAAAWLTAAAQNRNSGLAYYATYTRASEILVGVALAFLVLTVPVRKALASPLGKRAVGIGGILGLLGLAWLWTNIGLTSRFVFRGGTMFNATMTCLVILACISAAPGPVAKSLGIWPLRNLGRISYGVYLVHWPLFILLDDERTHLVGHPNRLFVIRLAASIGVAILMYHLLESPFRFKLKVSRRALAGVLAVPTVLLVPLIQGVPVHRGDSQNLGIELPDDPYAPNVTVPPPGVTPAARILLVGDSVTWSTWDGYVKWNEQHPDQPLQVDSIMALGCSLADVKETLQLGEWMKTTTPCGRLRKRTTDILAKQDYDAIVVTIGHKDLGQHKLEDKWRAVGDPVFDEFIAGEIAEWIDILAAEDGPVLWSSLTHVRINRFEDPTTTWANWADTDNNPNRVDKLNRIVADTIAEAANPSFQILDTGTWLESIPGGEFNPDFRGDGVHYTFDGADKLAEWVLPQVFEAVDRNRLAPP
jgi:peptidoglycan/LPS O-acetylase OafA/YrhL/lysophospholipase L1-like esterase